MFTSWQRRHVRRPYLWPLAVFTVAGCNQPGGFMGSTQNQNAYDGNFLANHLVVGRTTESDVVGYFGQPTSKSVVASSATAPQDRWQFSRDVAGTSTPGYHMFNMLEGADNVANVFGVGGASGIGSAEGTTANGLVQTSRLQNGVSNISTGGATGNSTGVQPATLYLEFNPDRTLKNWQLE